MRSVNATKFGVKSTYDEKLYKYVLKLRIPHLPCSTAIDKSHPDYKKRAQLAEEVARDIEASFPCSCLTHQRSEKGRKEKSEAVSEEVCSTRS